MSHKSSELVLKYFQDKGLNCDFFDPVKHPYVIKLSYKFDGGEIDFFLDFFSDVDKYVQITGCHFIEDIPADKIDDLYKVVNDLNREYRFVKFLVNAEHKDIVCQSDAVIDYETCGEEAYELMVRMRQIIEETYKPIMKSIWA